jgi:hypothetical protein
MKSWTWNGVAVWLDQHADRLDDQILQITKKCIENGKALHNILLEMEGATNEVRHQNILLVNAASRG